MTELLQSSELKKAFAPAFDGLEEAFSEFTRFESYRGASQVEEIGAARQDWGCRGVWSNWTEELHRLQNAGFFSELERGGQVLLCAYACGFIAAAVVEYSRRTKDLRSDVERVLQELREEADRAEALAKRIAYRLKFYFDYLASDKVVDGSLPETLRTYARETRPAPRILRRRGHPRRVDDEVLVQTMAYIYHRSGGRVAVSENGPFARFLTVVWGHLPRDLRAKTAEAFVAHAKRLSPRLRAWVGGISRLEGERAQTMLPRRRQDVRWMVPFKDRRRLLATQLATSKLGVLVPFDYAVMMDDAGYCATRAPGRALLIPDHPSGWRVAMLELKLSKKVSIGHTQHKFAFLSPWDDLHREIEIHLESPDVHGQLDLAWAEAVRRLQTSRREIAAK